MKKSRPLEIDMLPRRPMAKLRASHNRLDVAAEADIAGLESLMEAMIAAAMIIAHADGVADPAERRRLVSLFRASPLLQGFSVDDITREVLSHTHAFELDPASALLQARSKIETADLTSEQFRALIDACVAVLEADGLRHPAELEALASISSMRAPIGTR